jgi:hypothetical protein
MRGRHLGRFAAAGGEFGLPPVTMLRGRALIESRYGPLGCGAQTLAIQGMEYQLADLMSQMGLGFDDSRAIDVLTLPDGRHVIRYYDAQDQRVVAQEFESSFTLLGETRAHCAEWFGEQAYYSFFGGH